MWKICFPPRVGKINFCIFEPFWQHALIHYNSTAKGHGHSYGQMEPEKKRKSPHSSQLNNFYQIISLPRDLGSETWLLLKFQILKSNLNQISQLIAYTSLLYTKNIYILWNNIDALSYTLLKCYSYYQNTFLYLII